MSHFTPEQVVALKAEIALPKYAGMDDFAIAASINSQTYQVAQDVDRIAAITAMTFTDAGDWGKIVGVAEGVITAGISIAERVRAISIREIFNQGGAAPLADEVYWTKFVAAYNAIKPEITSQQGIDAITALRFRSVPLWQKFLYREIEWSDIAEVRTL